MKKVTDAQRREFGAWLRRERQRLGLTQLQLAAAARVVISTVHKAEVGTHLPQPRVREALREALAAAEAKGARP